MTQQGPSLQVYGPSRPIPASQRTSASGIFGDLCLGSAFAQEWRLFCTFKVHTGNPTHTCRSRQTKLMSRLTITGMRNIAPEKLLTSHLLLQLLSQRRGPTGRARRRILRKVPSTSVYNRHPRYRSHVRSNRRHIAPVVQGHVNVRRRTQVGGSRPQRHRVRYQEHDAVVSLQHAHRQGLHIHRTLLGQLRHAKGVRHRRRSVRAMGARGVEALVPIAFRVAQRNNGVQRQDRRRPQTRRPLVRQVHRRRRRTRAQPYSKHRMIRTRHPLTRLRVVTLLVPNVRGTRRFTSS